MHIILFDPEEARVNLLPLTFTRPVAHLRQGIMTIQEKWQAALPDAVVDVFPFAEELKPLFKLQQEPDEKSVWVAGNILPDEALVTTILDMEPGVEIVCQGKVIARCGNEATPHEYTAPLTEINTLPDIFLGNGEAIRRDFRVLTAGRFSEQLHPSCTLLGSPDDLFIEEGATLLACTINTMGGPVYIGRNATVMEGCCLRGPIALCESSQFNMGAHVWPDTTIGPHCKVGGEVSNTVFIGYSNKAHDGYLGNSVIGEWCNLGADCVSSNLKNNYAKIRLWNYGTQSFQQTGLQFCGLMMGDHSKAGINTMFNTATVVGVGCNVYGAGFPRTFIPSFTEGGPQGTKRVILSRFLETAKTVMARRHVELSPEQETLYTKLFNDICE